MARGEEIDALVAHRLLALERAEEARSRGHAGQALDARTVSQLDRVTQRRRGAARRGARAAPRAPSTTSSVSSSRSAGTRARIAWAIAAGTARGAARGARRRARGHPRARPRRRCARSTSAPNASSSRGRRAPAPRSPPRPRQLPLDAPERPLEEPERLVQRGDRGAEARRRAEVDDLDRDARGRCGRGGRCAARPSSGSTAGRTARAACRTRSCVPRRRTRSRRSSDGPPGSRNCATSMSRCPGDRSSWNTPTRSCARRLSAARSASSVSRVGDEDERLVSRVAPGAARAGEPGDARIARRAACARQAPELASSRGASAPSSAAPDASARRIRRAFSRRASGSPARQRAHRGLEPREGAPGLGCRDRRAAPTRGGSPPMSARRVALVHGGSGSRALEPRLERPVLGELLRSQELQQPEEAVRVLLERRRGQAAARAGRARRSGAIAR